MKPTRAHVTASRRLLLAFSLFLALPVLSCDDSTVEPLATDSLLSALTLSAGTISPAFATNTLTYGVAVTSAITSITVKPTAVSSAATIKVNGVTVASGANSPAITLSSGINSITISVTSPSGVTSTYFLQVIRG